MRALILIAAVLVTLISCTRPQYWKQTSIPVAVTKIVFTDQIEESCGPNTLGCFKRTSGWLFIKLGLEPILRACVLSHERRHADGWDHPDYIGSDLGIDCGDGTIMPGGLA